MEEAKSLHKNDPVAAHRHSLLGVDELYTMIQDVKVFTQTLKGNDLILVSEQTKPSSSPRKRSGASQKKGVLLSREN